jgi:hypothetical protein
MHRDRKKSPTNEIASNVTALSRPEPFAVNVHEAARLLGGIPASAVRRLVKSGQLPVIKGFGKPDLFLPEDIRALAIRSKKAAA